MRGSGLLRGACHPAALRADRVARNDAQPVNLARARFLYANVKQPRAQKQKRTLAFSQRVSRPS
jgi:hypothetical protein